MSDSQTMMTELAAIPPELTFDPSLNPDRFPRTIAAVGATLKSFGDLREHLRFGVAAPRVCGPEAGGTSTIRMNRTELGKGDASDGGLTGYPPGTRHYAHAIPLWTKLNPVIDWDEVDRHFAGYAGQSVDRWKARLAERLNAV